MGIPESRSHDGRVPAHIIRVQVLSCPPTPPTLVRRGRGMRRGMGSVSAPAPALCYLLASLRSSPSFMIWALSWSPRPLAVRSSL